MEVESKLLHKITITAVGEKNRYGELIAGTSTTGVACYIDGRISRVLNNEGQQIQSDFSILFLPNANIRVGYLVSSGVDSNGYSLLSSGRIVAIEDYNHPEDGQIAREAYVARG